MTTKMKSTVNKADEKETVPSSQIVFTSLVKKLSRRLKIWQQRILTLNSQGEIHIARIESKSARIVLVSSSSQHQSRHRRKPSINITKPSILARQGKPSDVGWPKKLDLRQTLVLKSDLNLFIFLPSVRAAEAMRTQMRILQMRQESENRSGEDNLDAAPDPGLCGREVKLRRRVSESIQSLPDIDSSQAGRKTSWCDDVISREGKDTELTLLTGLERQKSFSLVSLVEFTDTIRSSLSQDCSLAENLNDDKDNENLTEKQKQLETKSARGEKARGEKKEGRGKEDPLEVCFDFTSGPGYLACKRNSLLKDNSIISMNNLKRRDSLLFRPSTQFRPRPILKPESLYVGEKRESESRVRFNTCPSVRIISQVEDSGSESVERDYDLVSHYIYKYVVNSHKLKSDRFNARKKQA